jgi:sporulation protein YlmC with PRC-barrel domain
MRFSEAEGRKVVSTASAETVGRVSDFVIDPVSRTVAALVLKKTPGSDNILPWENLQAFGQDAVMIDDIGRLTTAAGRVAELSDKRFREHGKRVLSTEGVDLGKVADIEFDPETSAVTALVLAEGSIAGERLLAAGSYAVIVQA